MIGIYLCEKTFADTKFFTQLFPKKLHKKAARHNLRGQRAVVGKMNASHF